MNKNFLKNTCLSYPFYTALAINHHHGSRKNSDDPSIATAIATFVATSSIMISLLMCKRLNKLDEANIIKDNNHLKQQLKAISDKLSLDDEKFSAFELNLKSLNIGGLDKTINLLPEQRDVIDRVSTLEDRVSTLIDRVGTLEDMPNMITNIMNAQEANSLTVDEFRGRAAKLDLFRNYGICI